MTTEVDTANCPHCRSAVSDLNFLSTDTDERMMVCPECDTILGGSISNQEFAELLTFGVASDLDEATTFADAIETLMEADDQEEAELEDEDLTAVVERLEEQMGS